MLRMLSIALPTQTFQLESLTNLGISKSTGKKFWRLYLKPGDFFLFFFFETELHKRIGVARLVSFTFSWKGM